MIIRAIEAEDIEEIWRIENDSFIAPWPKQVLAEYALRLGFFCNAAISRSDGTVAGYCISTLVHDEIHVFKIAVSNLHRRKGIAVDLLSHTFDFYKDKGAISVILEVRTTNSEAIALYEKLGFEIIRTRLNYYGRGKGDAFVMGLSLDRYYQESLSTT